jgi:alpha-beta hydrolase superfamily lysophospholipase
VLENALSIQAPLLILHGGADRLVDPEGSVRLHEATKAAGSRLNVYPHLYHEVLKA